MTARRSTGGAGPEIVADIIVEAGDWPGRPRLKRLVANAIATTAEMVDSNIAADAEVAVILTDDRHMRVLNRRYRRKDAPTNVLSFPGTRPDSKRFGPLLGDILLGYETVRREAGEQRVAVEDHLTHLVVHGFLHLLGHDHQRSSEARVMERLETAILAGLGIADPYRDR
jgi:probable rRNA maturation factor